MKVLVTGGAGFIGSTVGNACADAGHAVVLLDDLSTGHRAFAGRHPLVEADVGDPAALDAVFAEHPDVDAVVHCAARTVVPESVAEPVGYYDTNVVGTLRLVEGLLRHGVRRLVFSSSAAVYASGPPVVDESAPLAPANPYARTKAITEQLLADVAVATPLRVLSLRYFNPVGADPLLRSGCPQDTPPHVLGRLVTAHRTDQAFTLFGTDWPTRDGTALRDFVHVWDLARAHVTVLERFDAATADAPHRVLNLGTGSGTTVRELVTAFAEVVGGGPEIVEAPRRVGDVVGACAHPGLARRLLGWHAELSLRDGVRDALAWAERWTPARDTQVPIAAR